LFISIRGIFTFLKESAYYRILVLLWVYFRMNILSCLYIPVEVSISDYQDNRSIVSAFAHSHIRGYIPFINDVIDVYPRRHIRQCKNMALRYCVQWLFLNCVLVASICVFV